MSSPEQFEPGSPAEVELELPEEELRLAAEVVRVEDGHRSGMALKFPKSLAKSRVPLANFIMQRHHAGR